MTESTPEFEALKSRLKATWMAGDFGQIARFTADSAREFIERRAITPGLDVLDVACGTGNLSIPAARAGARVTGIDIAPNLLEQARERAAGENLTAQFEEGDAEALPYPDASFDLVVSMFGAMFAPRPDRVAAELARVCRPGGRVAMANWTPGGFIGQLFRTTGARVPPPAGMPSPILWGDEATVRERLRDGFPDIETTTAVTVFRFPFPVAETVEFFRLYYGPTQRAFGALSEADQSLLRADLERLWSEHNRAEDGTTLVDSEYLDVVARRS